MTWKKIVVLLAALLLGALVAAGYGGRRSAAIGDRPVWQAAPSCGWCGHGQDGRGAAGMHHRWNCQGRQGPRLYNPATEITLSGSVVAVQVQRARRGRFAGVHVTLGAGGKETEVHLGPLWYSQAEGLVLTKGDKLEVTGSLVTHNEKTFVIAREVKTGAKVVKLRETDGRPLWGPRRRG